MKIYIVDTNVLFSAIVSPNNNIAKFILNRKNRDIEFYSPMYLLAEIERHKEKVKELGNIDEEDFVLLRSRIFKEIIFIEDSIIPFEEWIKALRLLRDIDPDDSAFVALNNFMNKTLWTGDMKLYNGLKAKGYENVVNFSDLKKKYGL